MNKIYISCLALVISLLILLNYSDKNKVETPAYTPTKAYLDDLKNEVSRDGYSEEAAGFYLDRSESMNKTGDLSSSDCDPNYTPCVPDVSYDLNCDDIRLFVKVVGIDTNRFDSDSNGEGCEAYR